MCICQGRERLIIEHTRLGSDVSEQSMPFGIQLGSDGTAEEKDIGVLEERLHDRVSVEARLLLARDDSLQEVRHLLHVEACTNLGGGSTPAELQRVRVARVCASHRFRDACTQWGEAREKREQAHREWLQQFTRR